MDQDYGILNLYLKEISKSEYNPLSIGKEAILGYRIRKGDKIALETLVKHNLRFVVSAVRKYQNQGLPLPDLIDEGNLGLIRAAKRFKPEKNFKFISYAVWWIRQATLQALSELSRIYKTPLHIIGTAYTIGKVTGKLEQKYQRAPDENDLACYMGEDLNVIRKAARLGMRTISLDAPDNDKNERSTLLEHLTYVDDDSPDDHIGQVSYSNEINTLLDSLDKREKEVVSLYFGINNDNITYTLDEIGQRINLTRERVRQIKEKALHRLKYRSNNPANIKAHARR